MNDSRKLKPLVMAFIDGAAEPNPGHGGAGVLLVYGDQRREISTYLGEGVTNNVAEIMAAITALEALKFPCTVEFTSDSQYLVKTMTGEFKRSKNHDCWARLDAAIQTGGHDVFWKWVRGHSGHRENERANTLAEQAARRRR